MAFANIRTPVLSPLVGIFFLAFFFEKEKASPKLSERLSMELKLCHSGPEDSWSKGLATPQSIHPTAAGQKQCSSIGVSFFFLSNSLSFEQRRPSEMSEDARSK